MGGRRLPGVREMSDQLEGDDGADARPVPPSPLTEATESLWKRSEGSTLAMVEKDA